MAKLLAQVGQERFLVWPVETNIVFVTPKSTGSTAALLQAQLQTLGVRVSVAADDTIRMVTHRHIGDDDVGTVAAAFYRLASRDTAG